MTILDRLLGRPESSPVKAAFGPGVSAIQNLPPLTVTGSSQQERMAAYLRAYKVGWFYKAERKISSDFANLKVTLSPEDKAGDNTTEIVAPNLFDPIESLSYVDQFLRLMERPNPHQTGRQLRQKSMIRHDMAGAAFFYLESPDAVFGLPKAIYGISPSRMWPSYDRNGELIGWVMDYNARGGGVPFTTDEILPWIAGSAEDGVWGVGVVEAVYAQVPLTDLMAKHTADVLTTGGRMAGMVWPKNRALEENEFLDAQRAWRNVVSDPNSAKRMLIFPEPMEYAAGASTPAEIGIPELALLNRDEILTAFPVDPVILGVPAANGLGGGEERRWQRLAYWEGTIHPRVESFEEVLQTGLVSRYEKAMGGPLDVDVEEPNLDDAPTLLEKAGAMQSLINLGFDAKEVAAALALDHLKFTPKPEPVAEPEVPPEMRININDTARRDTAQVTQPLTVKAVQASRADVTEPAARKARQTLATFLAEQQERMATTLRSVWPATKAARKSLAPEDWWDAAAETEALAQSLQGLYVEVGRNTMQVVADQTSRIVRPDITTRVINDLLTQGGTRITGINETTRDAVAREIATAVDRGYSISQVIDGVPAEKYGGVRKALMDNGIPAFDDLRAETIARTETALSYNRAALAGYREYNVREVVAVDGDNDADCRDRDGKTFEVDEAYGLADHPNGTLDWIPVIPLAGG